MSSHDHIDTAQTLVLAEMARTDTKAGTLLAALAVPVSVVTAVATGRHLGTGTAILTVLGLALLGAAMASVLWVVFPRLAGHGTGTWLHWAHCTEEELLADLTDERRTRATLAMAQRVKAKYRAVRAAVVFTAAGFAMLLAAALASLT